MNLKLLLVAVLAISLVLHLTYMKPSQRRLLHLTSMKPRQRRPRMTREKYNEARQELDRMLLDKEITRKQYNQLELDLHHRRPIVQSNMQ